MEKKTNTYEELSKINVNKFLDQKNGLSYLSWAYAVDIMSKNDEDWEYKVLEFNDNGELVEYGKPYRPVVNDTYEVRTRVTYKGRTKEMWLPVMDAHNLPIKSEPYQMAYSNGKKFTIPAIDSTSINKAIMRCLVKNIALFGLGMYVYAGEDLPMEDEEQPKEDKPKKAVKKEEPKQTQAITVMQKAIITKKCTEDVIKRILEKNGKQSLDELSIQEASDWIKAIKDKERNDGTNSNE